jgi:hypothetical protein
MTKTEDITSQGRNHLRTAVDLDTESVPHVVDIMNVQTQALLSIAHSLASIDAKGKQADDNLDHRLAQHVNAIEDCLKRIQHLENQVEILFIKTAEEE